MHIPELDVALYHISAFLPINNEVSILQGGGRGAIDCARAHASFPVGAQLIAPVPMHHFP